MKTFKENFDENDFLRYININDDKAHEKLVVRLLIVILFVTTDRVMISQKLHLEARKIWFIIQKKNLAENFLIRIHLIPDKFQKKQRSALDKY